LRSWQRRIYDGRRAFKVERAEVTERSMSVDTSAESRGEGREIRLAWKLAFAYAGLVLVIIVAWANSVGGGPIFDDHYLVVRQPCFKSWSGLVSILTLDGGACGYRPLRYLSYGIDHAIFGDVFWGYHLGNIIRHAFAAIVAGMVATCLMWSSRAGADPDGTGGWPTRADWWCGVVVAMLWSLHPVQTDSVSYVSGRRDILAGMWTLVAVGGCVMARARGGLWWLLPLWATLFGFMAKESAVVIPALFLVWEARTGDPRDWVRRHRWAAFALVVGFVLAGFFIVYRGVIASHSHRALTEWWGGSMHANFATVAMLQLRYWGQSFGVVGLIGDYHPDTIVLASGFGDLRALAGASLALVVCVVGGVLLRVRPVAGFGLLWYMISLAPVSQIIPHHELYAEHYLYIPLFGLALTVVDLGRWWVEATSRGDTQRALDRAVILASIAVLLCTAMGIAVAARNMVWHDERTFYESVIAKAPTNQRALGNLLYIYAESGDWPSTQLACVATQDIWTVGSGSERDALMVCTDAAARAGDAVWVAEWSWRLATRHPDLGLGHRRFAEAAVQLGRPAEAFASARRWYAITGAEAALTLAAQVVRPEDASVAYSWWHDARDEAHMVPSSVWARFAAAVAQSGDTARALEMMEAHATGAALQDPAYLALLCTLRAQEGASRHDGLCRTTP